VAGVPVDATAASAVAARQEALLAGQREGLRRLLRRLTRPEDAGRLPKVEALPVERFVESYQIADEKVSPTRYVAALSVAYAPEPVQGLLRSADVPFLERRAEPLLVLPALETAMGELDLWGEANPWRAAWNERAAVASPLVELRLPLADAGDVSTLGPGALSPENPDPDPDPGALAALGQRYEAQAVVVARARLLPGTTAGGGAGDADAAGKPIPRRPPRPAAAPAGVEVEARRSDRPDAEPFLRETVRAEPGEAEGALLGGRRTGWWRRWSGAEAYPDRQGRRGGHAPGRGSPCRPLGLGADKARAWGGPGSSFGARRPLRRGGATVTIAYVGGLEGLVGALGRRGLSLARRTTDGNCDKRPTPGPSRRRRPRRRLRAERRVAELGQPAHPGAPRLHPGPAPAARRRRARGRLLCLRRRGAERRARRLHGEALHWRHRRRRDPGPHR
jgi:hypothetical protein